MVSTRVATEAMNYVETIADLAYMIRANPTDAAVTSHASQIEERALALGQFLRSVTRELQEVGM